MRTILSITTTENKMTDLERIARLNGGKLHWNLGNRYTIRLGSNFRNMIHVVTALEEFGAYIQRSNHKNITFTVYNKKQQHNNGEQQ